MIVLDNLPIDYACGNLTVRAASDSIKITILKNTFLGRKVVTSLPEIASLVRSGKSVVIHSKTEERSMFRYAALKEITLCKVVEKEIEIWDLIIGRPGGKIKLSVHVTLNNDQNPRITEISAFLDRRKIRMLDCY